MSLRTNSAKGSSPMTLRLRARMNAALLLMAHRHLLRVHKSGRYRSEADMVELMMGRTPPDGIDVRKGGVEHHARRRPRQTLP